MAGVGVIKTSRALMSAVCTDSCRFCNAALRSTSDGRTAAYTGIIHCFGVVNEPALCITF